MNDLIIDLGTSSVRSLLFDRQGRALLETLASRPTTLISQPQGAAIFEALALRQAVEACLDETLAKAQGQSLRAVGLDTFVGNLLGVDADNRPLTSVFTYADTRSHAQVRRLAGEIDLGATHQRTGCLHHTAYHAGRLAWLRETQPEVFGRVATWLDFGTYLLRAWLGRPLPCSYSVASWTGLFNRQTLAWDAEWIRILGLAPETLPPLADFAPPHRGLSPVYAERWPALREAAFYLPIGDGAAANVGVGAEAPHTLALSLGTTGALRLINAEDLPPVPPGLWSYRVDAHRHLIGGATSEGGNIYAWLTQHLALGDFDPATLLARPAEAHGLVILPYWAGERSPGWAVDAVGTIHGLRLGTNPLDILQAAMEGVALRLSLIAERLPPAPERRLVATGGALSASPAWAQIVADALNLPLHLCAESEATARGTAFLIAEGNFQPAPPAFSQIFQPRPAYHESLMRVRQRQTHLHEVLYG
jgi:gluconokinase